MSDVIIPEGSPPAVAYVSFMDQFGNVIQGATFDAGTESAWWLDDGSIGTITNISQESISVTPIAVGQTNLHVTGQYQGQTMNDVALVTIDAQGGGYRISIEWIPPVPPV